MSPFSGGRKIHVKGSNMELVESVTFQSHDEELQTHYNRSTGVRSAYHACIGLKVSYYSKIKTSSQEAYTTPYLTYGDPQSNRHISHIECFVRLLN